MEMSKKFSSTKTRTQKNYQQGLSIVEVLVASVILIIIIVAAATVFPLGFKINEQSKTATAAENIAGAELEYLSHFKYSDIAPIPMPSPTPGTNTALINTTGYTYGSQSFTITNTQVTPPITLSYPKKVTVNKLNSNGDVIGSVDYRVDLKVYMGKYNALVALKDDDVKYASMVTTRNKHSSFIAIVQNKILNAMMNFIDPYAMAGNCAPSITVAPGSSQCIGQEFNFTAGSLTDCDHPYSWEFGDTQTAGDIISTSHGYATAGSKTVTFNAKQGGTTKSRTTAITVTDSGAIDLTITPGTTGYLNTTNFQFTVNPCTCCGAGTTYNWNFGAGEGADVQGTQVNHIFVTSGSKTATVARTNPTGSRQGTITILSSTASISVSPSDSGTTVSTFSFAGGGTDIGNTPTYTWNFGDFSPTVSGQTASHQYAQPGNYTVTLNITGGSNPSTTRLIIVAAAGAKSAIINSITPNPANPAQTITFTGSQSGFSELQLITYVWNFGDSSPDGFGQIVTHSYANGGNYPVTLTVIQGPDNPIATLNVNVASTVDVVPNPTAATMTGASVTIAFTANATGVGWSPTYIWNFGDGATSSGSSANTSHTYTATGTYTVTVEVTGGSNPTDSATVLIVPTASGAQSSMKKVFLKVSPWSASPPQKYTATLVTYMANNDKTE